MKLIQKYCNFRMQKNSQRLWKNIPTQKNSYQPPKLLRNPIIQKNSLLSQETNQILYFESVKSEQPISQICQTAKFKVTQFQSLIKSTEFQNMVNNLFSSSGNQPNSPDRNKKISLSFGKNLILSISNSDNHNIIQQKIQIAQKIHQLKMLHNSIKNSILTQKKQIKDFFNKIILLCMKINPEKQNLKFKAKINQLETRLEQQKNNLENDQKSIMKQFEKCKLEIQAKKLRNQQLQIQNYKVKQQNTKLSQMIADLSRQNQQLQESIFGYKQKQKQFDLQLSKRIQQFIEGHRNKKLVEQEEKIKLKMIQKKWTTLKEDEQEADFKISREYNQNTLNSKYLNYSKQNSKYFPNSKIYEQPSISQTKNLTECQSLDKIAPYRQYNKLYSPRNQIASIKIANMKMRLKQQDNTKRLSRVTSSKEFSSFPQFYVNENNAPKISRLQNRLQSLKNEIKREIREAQ